MWIPDADVVGFPLGIAYSELLGHRGLSHSLVFAAVLGLAAALLFRQTENRSWRQIRHLAMLFMLLAASHGPMDMLTNGGLGIALFSPFDPGRYFWDWRPILVSPIGLKNFLNPLTGDDTRKKCRSEFAIIAALCPKMMLFGSTAGVPI